MRVANVKLGHIKEVLKIWNDEFFQDSECAPGVSQDEFHELAETILNDIKSEDYRTYRLSSPWSHYSALETKRTSSINVSFIAHLKIDKQSLNYEKDHEKALECKENFDKRVKAIK